MITRSKVKIEKKEFIPESGHPGVRRSRTVRTRNDLRNSVSETNTSEVRAGSHLVLNAPNEKASLELSGPQAELKPEVRPEVKLENVQGPTSRKLSPKQQIKKAKKRTSNVLGNGLYLMLTLLIAYKLWAINVHMESSRIRPGKAKIKELRAKLISKPNKR